MSDKGFAFVELPSLFKATKQPDPLIMEFADFLRGSPGRWAKWPKKTTPSGAATVASTINNQRPNAPYAMRDGGFEARCRGGELYVRAVDAS